MYLKLYEIVIICTNFLLQRTHCKICTTYSTILTVRFSPKALMNALNYTFSAIFISIQHI